MSAFRYWFSGVDILGSARSMTSKSNRPRIMMTLGPGDVVSDHRRLVEGKAGSNQTSLTFSEQAIFVLNKNELSGLLVSYNGNKDQFSDNFIVSTNIPKRDFGRAGVGFHITELYYALRLTAIGLRFRPSVAVFDSGTSHFFCLFLFKLFGTKVVINFHNVRWPKGYPPKRRIAKLLRALDSCFFSTAVSAAMGCSPECEAQFRADGAVEAPFYPWAGQFSNMGFQPDTDPPADGIFRILFVGRVEHSKGVMDLLDIAELLKSDPNLDFQIKICGGGSALSALGEAVSARKLEDHILVCGPLQRPQLLECYRDADVVIVPTRSTFCEGMPLVCAEAMLAGRPLVTSALSNAIPVMPSAIVEVPPEDIKAYAQALRELALCPDKLSALRRETKLWRGQFLDRSRSYAASLHKALEALMPNKLRSIDFAAMDNHS